MRRPRGNAAGRVARLVLPLLCAVLVGCTGSQSVIDPQGPLADRLAVFFWVMTAIAGLILAVVLFLLVGGAFRARRQTEARPLSYVQSRNLVLWAGAIVPAVVLLTFTFSSASIDRAMLWQPPEQAVTVEVVGHQWWWEVHYLDREGKRLATTANEIHIPVGQPVRLLLKSTDVIHSFWVPNLNGKTDLVPGKTNSSWVQADRAGTYRGQCAEFCGLQHARMAFLVVAQAPQEFEAWLARQREPAATPADASALRGREVFLSSQCVMCHSIRGTIARGQVAPDLTHIGGRQTIAAANVPNTRGHLAGWILDPQNTKPGNFMPATQLAPRDLSALLDYLQGLR